MSDPSSVPPAPDNDPEPGNENAGPPQGIERWSNAALLVAVASLGAIAFFNAFGLDTPTINTVLMIGIMISGTVFWAIQARQPCPHCGAPYGYGFRIVNAHICRSCGGDIREKKEA